MPKRFDFISPGVSIREIDESTVAPDVGDDGILLIGQATQGPGNVPVKVKNLEDFYRIFGKPVSGKGSKNTDVWRDGNTQLTTYAMYAAQAWLASGTSPVTFIRLLGEDTPTAKQAAAYVKAGYYSGFNPVTNAENTATPYGLWIMPSGSSWVQAPGSTKAALAAVIYATGSAWGLAGTLPEDGIESGTKQTEPGNMVVGSWVESISTGGIRNTFTLVHSTSAGHTKHNVHFSPDNADGYIRNTINCNPQLVNSTNQANTETYWLGETFEEWVESITNNDLAADMSNAAGKQYGILLPLGGDYAERRKEATAAKTGWFINRNATPQAGYDDWDIRNESKLFRLVSLHEGEWFAQNYGVKIDNIRLGTTANPDSTFSVVIIDADGVDIERWDNCNLNQSSVNFVANKIGDQFQTYNDTLEKHQLFGEYKNNSDYVRVEMAPDWEAGVSDSRQVPWGFWGPLRPKSLTINSGSANTFGTNTFGVTAGSGSITDGHHLGGDDGGTSEQTGFVSASIKHTASAQWPIMKLTDQNTNDGANYTPGYTFGVRQMFNSDNKGKKQLWYTKDYRDLVRPLPNSLSSDELAATTEISFMFSLDQIVKEEGQNLWFHSSGSHDNAGTETARAYTAKSGSAALLTAGIKQFQAPFFGGSDGLDVRQVDPFSIVNGLANTVASAHYAFYSAERALDLLEDPDLLKFDLASFPGNVNETLNRKLIRGLEERGDALAIIDIDSSYRKAYEAGGTEALGTSTQIITNTKSRDYNSSYAAAYYPPVRLRDDNGDVTIVPPSVAAIGAIGFSEANSQGPWFAPAGFNRGGISILGGNSGPRVAGTTEHLTKQNRDDLYEVNINPIARFPAVGEIVIFGQKTLQQTNSALDRINVRRLLIYLKKEINAIANTILFDQNVRTTWLRFKTAADRVLSDVQSRLGITEYKLVLDETTTTADLVDRNILYAKVFVKPARAIEFIAIDFVITKTGIEF
jgi:hypothetical protein